MSDEKLIITPLKKAVASLKKALVQPKTEFTRDAAIQHFEYTFELSWKLLKRHLQEEDFSNSNLPFKVALVDWQRITTEFQKKIQAEWKEL